MRTNKDYRKYNLKSNYFETIDSHEKAAILGFIYADGYNNQKNGKMRIAIHKQDIDYLEKVNFAIQPDKKDPIKFTYSCGFKSKNKQDRKNRNIACLTIYCQKICNDLANIGCIQAKSLIAKFPNILLEFLPSFLLGYLDGDGCITYTKYKGKSERRYYAVRFCVSNDFGKVAQKIIKETINVNSSLHKKGKISSLNIGGNIMVNKFLDWLYSKSPIRLNRKYQKYLEMKQYFKDNPLKSNYSHPKY